MNQPKNVEEKSLGRASLFISTIFNFNTIWNTRVVTNIGNVSLSRKFCLNSRIYNVSSKV